MGAGWLYVLHFPNVRQSTARIYSVMTWGTGRFDKKSFRYKFTRWRSKKFQLLGLKNEEHSLKMFFLFTRKLYLKSSKFSCNFTAWARIKTTCFETTLNRNGRFPWDEVTHNIIFCSEKRKNGSESSIQTSPVCFILFHCLHEPLKLASLMATCHQVNISLPGPYNLKEVGWKQLKHKKRFKMFKKIRYKLINYRNSRNVSSTSEVELVWLLEVLILWI